MPATCVGRLMDLGQQYAPARQDAMVETGDAIERCEQQQQQQRESARSGEGALSAMARLQQQQRSRAAQAPRESAAADLSSEPGAGSGERCPDRAPRT